MFVTSRRQRRRGLSVMELMVVMLLTGIIFAVTQMVLTRTIDSWWRVNANQESEQQLYRAQASLERDLRGAAFELSPDRVTVGLEKKPSQLASLSGSDGDVLWFLSAIDPKSGSFVRTAEGTPFWQRNVLYYAVCPLGLSDLNFLGTGRQVNGYEVACPMKILIRKEIDFGPQTTPTSDPSAIEKLMPYSAIAEHLNRPTGYNCAGMAASNATVKPVAANVLTFRADLDPQLRGISLDVRCTAVERARREGTLSDRDLTAEPSTTQLQFVILPPNLPPPPSSGS